MRLLGTLRSPYVRKVRVVAAEAGLMPRIDLDLRSVHLAAASPDVMAINPLNKVPTLIADDGSAIFDSFVICDYLVREAGRSDLLPPEMPERLAVLKTHALGHGMLDLMILRLVERAKPAERVWPEVMEATAAKLGSALDYLDAGHDALGAEGCTLGTLTVAVALGYLDFRFSDIDWRAGREGLAGWYAELSARPSVRDNPFMDETPALAGKVR